MGVISIFYILLLSALSSVAGRAGGMGKYPEAIPTWMPMWLRRTWVRDWLCPLFCLLLALPDSWAQFGWWLIAYGTMGGMLTTYWDNV